MNRTNVTLFGFGLKKNALKHEVDTTVFNYLYFRWLCRVCVAALFFVLICFETVFCSYF